MNGATIKRDTLIRLLFSDFELGPLLANSKPPDGITISQPQTIIQASDVTGGVFQSIIISFSVSVSARLFAEWLLKCFKKSGKPSGAINKKEVAFKKQAMLNLVHEELAKQNARKAQGKSNKKRLRKKRP